jgi:23S rRNA pseudouridine1911/1915/1917 synthase
MNRTRVKQVLRSGRVHVNGVSLTRHDPVLNPNDRLTLSAEAPIPSPVLSFAICYHDEFLLVIDKPAGLLTVATDREKHATAYVALRDYLEATREGQPFVVHRLDRETSGLLLFSLNAQTRDRLQEDWPAVTKTYWAIVEGTLQPMSGIIDNHLVEGTSLRVHSCAPDRPGAQRAISRYDTLAQQAGRSLVEVELVTGRKHQIRVHLAGRGCPIIGDSAYGAKTNPAGRLGLHARRLAFPHPMTGDMVRIESPWPPELARVLAGPSRGAG